MSTAPERPVRSQGPAQLIASASRALRRAWPTGPAVTSCSRCRSSCPDLSASGPKPRSVAQAVNEPRGDGLLVELDRPNSWPARVSLPDAAYSRPSPGSHSRVDECAKSCRLGRVRTERVPWVGFEPNACRGSGSNACRWGPFGPCGSNERAGERQDDRGFDIRQAQCPGLCDCAADRAAHDPSDTGLLVL